MKPELHVLLLSVLCGSVLCGSVGGCGVASNINLITGTAAMADSDTQASPKAHAREKSAVSDLAGRLGVSKDSIESTAPETVQWRNSSVGCPRPGMQYAQMLVAGYRIRLVHDGRSYWYHGREGGEPFYCERPEKPAEGSAGTGPEYLTE